VFQGVNYRSLLSSSVKSMQLHVAGFVAQTNTWLKLVFCAILLDAPLKRKTGRIYWEIPCKDPLLASRPPGHEQLMVLWMLNRFHIQADSRPRNRRCNIASRDISSRIFCWRPLCC